MSETATQPLTTPFEYADTTTAARRRGAVTTRGTVARRASIIRRSLYGARLRAYDSDTLGYARLRDTVGRLLGSS